MRGRLRILVGMTLVGAVVIGGGTWYYFHGPCGKARVAQAGKDLDAIASRWADGIQLVANTPRIALAPQVEKLQAIKRDAEALELPACLDPPRAHMVQSMRVAVDEVVRLMALNSGDVNEQRMMQVQFGFNAYREGVAAVARCVPFCGTRLADLFGGAAPVSSKPDSKPTAVPTATAVAAVTPRPHPKRRVYTLKDYDKLADGMTYAKVVSILGKPTRKDGEPGNELCRWDNPNGSRIVVSFAAGVVYGKNEIDLW